MATQVHKRLIFYHFCVSTEQLVQNLQLANVLRKLQKQF